MSVQIRPIAGDNDIKIAKDLVIDFVKALPVDVDFQGIHGELESFPSSFDTVLVAENDKEIIGTVALKDLRHIQDGACEMKRMYIKPEGRGTGAGKLLALALLKEAKKRGYTSMLLDTLARLEAAVGLYEHIGFKRRTAYYDNPIEDVIYMEKTL